MICVDLTTASQPLERNGLTIQNFIILWRDHQVDPKWGLPNNRYSKYNVRGRLKSGVKKSLVSFSRDRFG